MEYALESIATDPKATTELWLAHWEETETQYRIAPLNPDIDLMKRMDENGKLRYFTARDNGALVGHLLFAVGNDRLTMTPSAGEEFFYLTPEHRKGRNALRLINFAIAYLKAEGMRSITMTSKLTTNRGIDSLLKHVGFRHVSNLYVL
jgi:GNAT superfamily N-acetyltransferase